MTIEQIRKKQEETAGLLTQKAAAKVLGEKKLATLEEGEKPALTLRVEKVFTPIKFSGKREGTVCRVNASDDSGTVTLVLWDAKTSLTSLIENGDVVQISGFIVKSKNPFEMHSTRNSTVTRVKTIQPDSLPALAYLKEGARADFFAKVIQTGEKRFFEKNTFKGTLAKCIVQDGVEMPLVLWDENAELVDKIKPGGVIKIEGGRVKNNNGVLEVHAGRGARILLNPPSIPKRFSGASPA